MKAMKKRLILGFGFALLTALPLAAQTASEIEKNHPLEAPTDENPQYRQRKEKEIQRRSKISQDPNFKTGQNTQAPAAKPTADSTATTPPDAEKNKPKNP
jgi:hypothetical protein